MSTERDLLRDYARENALAIDPAEDPFDREVDGSRGTLAGKAFMALQNVLDLLPEIEEKNGVPHVAEKVRDAIRKGLS